MSAAQSDISKFEYPPAITEEEQGYIIGILKDWSIAHGLTVRPPQQFVDRNNDPQGILATTAPVTIFPSLFPRQCFDEALAVQPLYNKLYAAIARDEAWLLPIIEELKGIDDFVAELWKVYEAVAKEDHAQDLTLGLFRSDYMVHSEPTDTASNLSIRQVEFNTIASSFGGLSGKVTEFHQYLATLDTPPIASSPAGNPDALRLSGAARALASGLALAHRHYKHSDAGRKSCIIFVVQDPENNVFDQRHIEYEIQKQRIPVFRLAFHAVQAHTRLASDRTLVYSPSHARNVEYEVSTIYFRAGYSPDEYRGAEDWQSRLLLEKSRAIKCPSILTHLAGCKKVQQVLATPLSPDLARFLPNPEEAERIRKTFAPIYPLDDSEAGVEARRLATDPETARRFVLKPQREGGGNNVYRTAIPDFLKSIPESKWAAYILMEMIEPPPQRNTIVRLGEVQTGGVICELGIYGVCLWSHKKGIVDGGNYTADYLLRTKGDQSEEGGVAAGFGAIDSVCLIDP